ncbi:MAG TPA: PAS domain S-box protein [Bryobacteraceae bacterium]|nr:PAS domain S-box protein [Bryobacteraceae bacterium]
MSGSAAEKAIEPGNGQRRFEALVNSIDGIVWELELPAWNFTFVSQQAERILGYSLKQWKNRNFWTDHLHADDRATVAYFCNRAVEKAENQQFGYRMIASDGRVVWLRDFVTVEISQGQPTRLRGVMVDVTEQGAHKPPRRVAGTGKSGLKSGLGESVVRVGEGAHEPPGRFGGTGKSGLKSGPGESVVRIGETAAEEERDRKHEQAFHEGQKQVLEMIASAAPLSDILKSILHLIELQSNGMLCSILLLGDDGLHVRHGAAPSLPEGYIRAINGAPIGPKAGSCGTAMYRGKPVIVTDILADPLWEDYRELAQAFGLRACWSTPILSARGAVLGSFAMYYHEPRHPNAAEMRLTGVATHLAGIAIERQNAEQALRQSEEKYRRIVDTANEGIWVVDDNSTIVFANQRMAGMLGYSMDEMLGHSSLDFVEDAWRDQINQQIERRRAGFVEQFDLCLRRKDGSNLWGIVSRTPILGDNGSLGGALGMVTDITERKRAEDELRRSSEQIREMAGALIVAQEEERRRIARELHDDIVQKIAVLSINMSRLKQKSVAAGHSIAADIAVVQQRIAGLADDVRQLSHQLHPAVLEHAGLIAALRSFTDEFKRLEEIDVKLHVPENNDAIPRNIALCVYRVVQESLRNVAKHSQARTAEVSLAIENNTLQLMIKDDGKGFEVSPASTGGLGLMNIRERVHLCQGTVEIASKLNSGTTVTASIPLLAS